MVTVNSKPVFVVTCRFLALYDLTLALMCQDLKVTASKKEGTNMFLNKFKLYDRFSKEGVLRNHLRIYNKFFNTSVHHSLTCIDT